MPSNNLKVELNLVESVSELERYNKPIPVLIALRFLAARAAFSTKLEDYRNHLLLLQKDITALPIPKTFIEKRTTIHVFEFIDREYSQIIELAKQGVAIVGRVRSEGTLEEMIQKAESEAES